MPPTKPIHIEDYRPHQQYPAIKIVLDGKLFRAKIQDSNLCSETLDGLKRELYGRIEVLVADIPWTSVIQLTLQQEGVMGASNGDPLAAAVSARVERYHVAIVETPEDGLRDNGRSSWSGKIYAPWDKTTKTARLRASKNWYHYFGGSRGGYYEAPRTENGELALPSQIHTSGGSGGETYLLHYTEEAWTALLAIVQAIHNLRSQLRTIAGSPELVKALSTIGAQMLDASRLLPGMSDASPQRALPAADAPRRARRAQHAPEPKSKRALHERLDAAVRVNRAAIDEPDYVIEANEETPLGAPRMR